MTVSLYFLGKTSFDVRWLYSDVKTPLSLSICLNFLLSSVRRGSSYQAEQLSWSWLGGSKMKNSPMIYNYVHSEMKREILQQWHKSIPWWIGKEQIKIVSSLWYIMRIWTNIFPWCTVLFAGGMLGMGSPVGVWFPLFLCIISYAAHVPTVSKGPRFPFQCGPRDT